jgi:hypothetical protein
MPEKNEGSPLSFGFVMRASGGDIHVGHDLASRLDGAGRWVVWDPEKQYRAVGQGDTLALAVLDYVRQIVTGDYRD